MRDDFSVATKEMLAKRVGHKCSNPNCRQPTSGPQLNSAAAINIGVAAHIKAASPGGKRYDSDQTPEQRKSIDNGIWLCQNCSKLVDSDEMKYTVEYFQKWKKMSEDAALLELEEPALKKDSGISITSINQSGGITAHTVNVNKPPKRTIVHSRMKIIEELKKFSAGAYRLHYMSSDTEAANLAHEIDEVLTASGWRKIDPIQRLGGPQLAEGVTVYIIKDVDPPRTLLNHIYHALGERGVQGELLVDVDNVFKVHGWPPVELPGGMEGVVIFIGPNPYN